MRPAQVATELVGFAVTTGRLMMSSTAGGALVVVFAMSLILPDDGYPDDGYPGYGNVRVAIKDHVSRRGFNQLYRFVRAHSPPGPSQPGRVW